MSVISVLGGGAWGTALAAHLARADKNPLLWVRKADVCDAINHNRCNHGYLPDITLPSGIRATMNLCDLRSSSLALIVIPTQSIRSVLGALKPILSPHTTLILCAKGIETRSGKRISEIANEVMPDHPIAVLSGPSFADDVARGLPTALTLAAHGLDEATRLAHQFSNENLRTYASDDVIGTELGGALKNVIALAVGIARAKGLGASAEAALTSRGFAELSRIARHFGAKPETLMGLSGLGDLILTCSSEKSRNFAFGMAVGSNQNVSSLKLAEGVHTAAITAKLCARNAISAPIIDAIQTILTQRKPIEDVMTKLMSRPLKTELD